MNKFTGILLGCLLALAGFAAQAAPYTTATYYGLDATDSPVVAMNQAGTVIWRKTYAPYGKASNKDQDNRIGYTGHVENANGLVDAGARHYDPALGVFTSDDPVRFDENNPASFNRYAYANNNPYKFVDPDGRIAVLAAIPWIVGALSAGATGYEIGSAGYGVYSGQLSGSDLAGGAAKSIAINAALKAVPGGVALSVAKKIDADTYLKKGTEIFRVHGADNKGADGYFWTTKNPKMSSNYRDDAGLPNDNKADTLITGELNQGTFAGGGKAVPLDGNRGGWPESRIVNAKDKVDVKNVEDF